MNIKIKFILLFIVLLSILAQKQILAHDGHKHKQQTNNSDTIRVSGSSSHEAHQEMFRHSEAVTGFPSLHPLVVHFPIVFLLLAAISQLVAVVTRKKEYHLAVFFMVLIGFIGAYVASELVHPHTEGLTASATTVLKGHELAASLTLWFSLAALLLKALSIWKLYTKTWFEIIVLVILSFTAVSVSIAGHMGAKLVHIEGVGPQGKYLEVE